MNVTATPKMTVDDICDTAVCRFVVNWIIVPLLKFLFFFIPITIVVFTVYAVYLAMRAIYTLISSAISAKIKGDYNLQSNIPDTSEV